MDLIELIQRDPKPAPWAEGEKIPWNETGFSQRMLREHLSQEHDWASRRASSIEKHVEWIHREVLSGRSGCILDLGCGPGLYTSRLAGLGHECSGVDFSPASIQYAREFAQKNNLRCSYQLEDVRKADYGSGCNLVLFIFGEFNVFTPQDAGKILQRAFAAIRPGGSLLLEVHTFDLVRQVGQGSSTWYSADSGLFSERPHLCLQENFWDEERSVATSRYFIVDAQTSQVTRYASSMQAYTEDQYQELMEKCGFQKITYSKSLTGEVGPTQPGLFAILAHKR